MGLHLIAYNIKGIDSDSGYGPYFIVEKYNGFDSVRHSGDRDFWSEVDFKYRPDGDDPSNYERQYFRPADFDFARSWVKNRVIECNQQRLLDLLDDMEKDETLYLYASI